MPQYVEVKGQTIEFPDGMSAPEIEAAIKRNMMSIAPEKPAAVKAGGLLNEIPRQVGLAARYGVEGLANIAQIGTEPIRYLQDKLTPDRTPSLSQLVTGERTPKSLPLGMIASQFADKIGLPSPQNANERVVGDATRLMAGAGAFGGAANAASKIPGMVGKAGELMGANMLQQLTAAAGGGLAGGASREAGGSTGMQVGASALGTVLGGLSASGITSLANRFNAMRSNPMQLDGKIALALREVDMDYSAMPAAVRNALREDVRKAMATGGELNADALRRLASFRATGTTPTRGMVTLDPVQLTREKNLAKLGANSSDDALQGLARVQNENNSRLIRNLNDLGAANGSVDDAGNAVASAITGRRDSLRNAEQSAWDTAKGSPGYRQPISSGILSDINRALDEEGLMPFMSKEISNYMAAFQNGQRPFTPQDYRNLQSMLAREASAGGNAGYAASTAQRILRNADVVPLQPNGPSLTTGATAAAMRADDAADIASRQSLDAVNQARGATRSAYAYEDSSPLVRSVLSDGASADPQRIAQRFVVGGTSREAADLAQEVGPQGLPVIKNALLAHLKEKAVNGAADEVANFSQSAFNAELRKIGLDKLRLFFSPEEIQALQANGRVASYMQVQPAGSAVNNSNTAGAAMGTMLDLLPTWIRNAPVAKPMVFDPLKSLEISLSQRNAQNLTPAMLNPQQRTLGPALIGPSVAMGGLLAAPGVDRP